ncbi:MAG TPA: hypothetical protein VLV49_05305 [Terriglobales bacterium]|nr:hypothetical protein [Terriglobales bacterium]
MADESTTQETPGRPAQTLRKAGLYLLIIAAFAGAYLLGKRRRNHTLDAFAQCLATKQVKMYGAFWCPHCKDQKDLFGASFEYVPYVECGIKGSREESPACLQIGIKRFPTWDFHGQRHEGVLPLDLLSAKTGCSLQ